MTTYIFTTFYIMNYKDFLKKLIISLMQIFML